MTRRPAPAGPARPERRQGRPRLRDRLSAAAGRVIGWPLLGLVWLYRHTLSPFFGFNCRFQPSCSEYASEAVRQYGGIAGGWLAMKRLGRCHPWGGSGYDPVPRQPCNGPGAPR